MIRHCQKENGSPVPLQKATKSSYDVHDLIFTAVHLACDMHEFDAAKELLRSAEASIVERSTMPETKRRHGLNALVAAHERLWVLRHGSDDISSYLPPPK